MIDVIEGAAYLKQGQIIAYPTEAVFGLGCCPFNESALSDLVALKARSPQKGMILIASSLRQILPFIDLSKVPEENLQKIILTWPGPYTWVFPVSNQVSSLIKGKFETVAVRVTAHPIAKALCEAFGGALVSTSANISAQEPVKTAQEASDLFQDMIAGIVQGEVGDSLKPTTITDAITWQIYR